MWSLVKILQGTLDANDPRWLAFGLPMPSTPSTPAQPTGLTAELNAAGNIAVACDPTPLASRYRFRMKLVGVQSEYQLAASSPAPMAAIAGVLPGQTVEIIVQAVNGSLQSVPSASVTFTVLLPVKAAEAPAAKVALELPALATNGTGSTAGFRLRH